MIGFGFSVFTQAILGLGGGFRGSALNLDFTSGSRTLDPRVTFSRTTNATLTNSAGLVSYAPHNLLTYSEQFDNAFWTKTAVTISANSTAAPNGTLTADKIVEGTASSTHRIFQNMAGATSACTFSVYAKSAERTKVELYASGTISTGCGFDLSTGTTYVNTVNSANQVAGTITSVGNGWYRCSIPVNIGSDNRVYLSDGTTTNYTGNGVSGLYIWGAQLEIGSTATTYNPTTVKNLLGYTEHFDNAAWTKSNAFVQTNLLLQSQNFENASWAKQAGAAVTSDTTTAPDGTVTADTLQNVNGVSSVAILQLVTLQSATSYTKSIWLRAGTTGTVVLGAFASGFLAASATIESGPGTVSGSSLITVSGLSASEWTRVRYTVTGTGVSTSFYVYPETTGSGTGKNIILWGAQLVQGTSAGDYKATYATAAAVGYSDIYGQPFAQKIIEDTANTAHGVVQLVGSADSFKMMTLYAKAASAGRFLQFYCTGSVAYANFDLTSGTVTASSSCTTSIQDVGNGWYRCSMLPTDAKNYNYVALIINSGTAGRNPAYTGDGTSGIYIFGAQLSDSASVDPYVYNPVAAPTAQAYYGPRFDYDPVTLAPKGLLIEEQRTNLVLRSEEFENASWTKAESSVTANAAVSPDSATTADKLIASTAATTHLTTQAPTVVSGTTYTFSVNLKAAEYGAALVGFVGSSGFGTTSAIVVNLTTGAISAGTGTLLSSSAVSTGNGWWRVSVSLAASASAAGSVYVAVINGTTFADRLNAGDGTSGIYIWGAQLEAGAFATSYIPTGASQVTRIADSASMIGNNFARWYNVNEGSAFVDVLLPSTALVDGYPLRISGANALVFGYKDVGTIVRPITGTVAGAGLSTTAAYKASGAYSFTANEKIGAVNGALATPLTTTGAFGQNTAAEIGGFSAGAGKLNGTIKRIAYFPRRLSNAELQGITS